MEKKTRDDQVLSFTQAINISNKWCNEWQEELLSDEVLADRVSELLKTKHGLRGFFAYALSDPNCKLLDRLPNSLIFKFRESGENIVELTVSNLVMSSAQVINHKKSNNKEYEKSSNNISERCINLLRVLDTNIVTKTINKLLNNIDNLGNSMDNSSKYDESQKEYIRTRIKSIAT